MKDRLFFYKTDATTRTIQVYSSKPYRFLFCWPILEWKCLSGTLGIWPWIWRQTKNLNIFGSFQLLDNLLLFNFTNYYLFIFFGRVYHTSLTIFLWLYTLIKRGFLVSVDLSTKKFHLVIIGGKIESNLVTEYCEIVEPQMIRGRQVGCWTQDPGQNNGRR